MWITTPSKLSIKAAKAIIRREIYPASTAGVKKSEGCAEVYEMRMGNLRFSVQKDFSGSGNISFTIHHCTGGTIQKLFNPQTLEEDFAAESKQSREDLKEHILDFGETNCQRLFERQKQ